MILMILNKKIHPHHQGRGYVENRITAQATGIFTTSYPLYPQVVHFPGRLHPGF
jgi:hypothetical protein